MFIDARAPLGRELVWYAIAAPIFGYACALMAESQGRRKWLWFLLGFFFTAGAPIALAYLSIKHRQTQMDERK